MAMLEANAMQTLLREAVRARCIESSAKARGKMVAAGVPPLTMEEINSEI